MIKIYFVNWWSSGQYPDIEINDTKISIKNGSYHAKQNTLFFLEIIKKYINNIEIIPENKIDNYTCIDILFIGLFGNKQSVIKFIKNHNIKCKILWSGENLYFSEKFKEYHDYLLDYCDLSMGSDYIDKNNYLKNNYLRVPYWVTAINFTKLNIHPTSRLNINNFIKIKPDTKKKGICMVSNSSGDGMREYIFSELSKVFEVDSPGKLCRNIKKIPKGAMNKLKFLSNYRFNICFENSSRNGYVTEKIFESLLSGCIPIYYGNEGQPPEFINEEFIIHLYSQHEKKNNLKEVIEKITSLNSNDKSYINHFKKQIVYNDKLNEYLDNIINCIVKKIKNNLS